MSSAGCGHVCASDWVRKYAKVDSHEAQALWKAAWNPMLITVADSDHIFLMAIPDHGAEKDIS